MINTVYKLTAPRKVETFFSDITIGAGNILVRPDVMSICKADLRYYFGLRDAKILRERLPLALIHEAAGTVLYGLNDSFRAGDKVILLPNIPGEDTGRADENYRFDSLFRSSKADGFMQEMVSLPPSQVVKYKNIPTDISSFIEFISVGVHSVKTYLAKKRNVPRRIGVWGDGSLSYVVSAILKYYLPATTVSVIGVQQTKLDLFQFVDEIYTIDQITQNGIWFDDTFECVGGQESGNAISQMIDVINPEGVIMLMGVSENPIGINTRMVLEKGLMMIGRSRSRREDFEEAIKILETNEKMVRRMKALISDTIQISKVEDINLAFEKARAADFKVILNWRI